MPECTATADNYYVREGKYITEWEPEVIGQIYGAAYRNGAVTEEIRFSDTSLYDQAKAYLIDEQLSAIIVRELQDYRILRTEIRCTDPEIFCRKGIR